PAQTTGRLLYDRIDELMPDPLARRALWGDFGLAYQYLHSDALIRDITKWGWPAPTEPDPAGWMTGFENEAGPRQQQILVTDADALHLADGHLVSFAVDVEQALCPTGTTTHDGRPCTFGASGALGAPTAQWRLALLLEVPAGAWATVYRVPLTGAPSQLDEVLGPRAKSDPILVDLDGVAPRDRIVVTVVDDPDLGTTGADVSLDA